MRPKSHHITTLAAIVFSIVLLSSGSAFAAKEAPIKEILSSHFGWEVNKTTKAKICTVESKNECQPAKPSGEPGGFEYPESISAPTSGGDIFVADRGNHRIQELTNGGQFVLMAGKGVNKKGGNLCTQAEETECQTGQEGSGSGELAEVLPSIAVEPAENGGESDIYIAERLSGAAGGGERIQKLTATGAFVLEVGKEVNETTKANLCTQHQIETEHVKCGAPKPTTATETGAFTSIGAIAVGGPENRLYVGERNGLQEFESDGKLVSEPAQAITMRLQAISTDPSSKVTTLAVDKTGDLYLTYFNTNVIRRYDPAGKETELPIETRAEGAALSTNGIALDADGRLAVSENENGQSRGTFYEIDPTILHPITQFEIPQAPYQLLGMTFNSQDELFLSSSYPGQEVTAYEPLPVGELATLIGEPPVSKTECKEGPIRQTDATFECALIGEIDPWGVTETEAWFEWGRTPVLGEKTPPVDIPNEQPTEGVEEKPVTVTAAITGLRPNEATDYYYQLAGHDHWVKGEEQLTSPPPLATFKTQPVPPRITALPTVLFIKSSSVVFLGELNPENATTQYEFQYAPANSCQSLGEACAEMGETSSRESSEYGQVPTTLEATGLQANTTYRYRLHATNTIAEEGIYENGIENESTFTTQPPPPPVEPPPPPPPTEVPLPLLPVQPPLAQLPIPHITFPTTKTTKCKSGYQRNKSNKCVKAKKTKKTGKVKKTRKT